MKANRHNSSKSTRRFGSAMLTLCVLLFFLLMGVVKIAGIIDLSLNIYIYSAINAMGCFLFVKQNPKSIWYAPLVINSFLIVLVLFDSCFLVEPFFVPVCTGLALCLIASILGALFGKRRAISHNIV
ncbi:MAG TPA: hypothetical protein DCL77_16265 [Prolixibacteraceae bacterium]|jgi:hypothetical protein|nr:hypothetical protein [Prolixibacteraceae bacterium]